jgi:hypothetical protein
MLGNERQYFYAIFESFVCTGPMSLPKCHSYAALQWTGFLSQLAKRVMKGPGSRSPAHPSLQAIKKLHQTHV